MDEATIDVSVVYAPRPGQVWSAQVRVPDRISVQAVIFRSGILEAHPEIDLVQQKIGIFGQIVPLHAHVVAGDRIEIYRPLMCDPKQARLRRAEKQRT